MFSKLDLRQLEVGGKQSFTDKISFDSREMETSCRLSSSCFFNFSIYLYNYETKRFAFMSGVRLINKESNN